MSLIEELASAVPDMVRLVVFLVMLSELESPVSSVASRSSAAGALGVLVSIVMLRLAEDAEVLPAESVAVAVRACVVLADSTMSSDQLPAPLAVVEPTGPS